MLGRGQQVAVVGGGGFYGRYLVADLLRFTGARVVVVSRAAPRRVQRSGRIIPVACDLHDPAALAVAVRGCSVVVHCAGPFQRLPLGPLEAAITVGAHYVDIAEDHEFRRLVLAAHDDARTARITVLNGASVVPGMEVLAAELLRPRFDRLLALRGSAAPDTRRHRGPAMFHTMLLGAGRWFGRPQDGRPRRTYGWSEPEWFDFPPPLGRRLHYQVLEMADLTVLPALLGVETVSFKAGSEWPALNRLLGLAATLRARTGHPRLEAFTSLVRGASWLAGRFGDEAGGVIFELTGHADGRVRQESLAVVGERDGGRIPSVLAGMAVEELLAGRLDQPGIADLRSWISHDRLLDGFRRRELVLWRRQGREPWRRYPWPQPVAAPTARHGG